MLEHLPEGDVVVPCQSNVKVTLIVTEIEVDLAAVVKHEALPMFKGTQKTGIPVQIRVDLDGSDYHIVLVTWKIHLKNRKSRGSNQGTHPSSQCFSKEHQENSLQTRHQPGEAR